MRARSAPRPPRPSAVGSRWGRGKWGAEGWSTPWGAAASWGHGRSACGARGGTASLSACPPCSRGEGRGGRRAQLLSQGAGLGGAAEAGRPRAGSPRRQSPEPRVAAASWAGSGFATQFWSPWKFTGLRFLSSDVGTGPSLMGGCGGTFVPSSPGDLFSAVCLSWWSAPEEVCPLGL